MKLLNERKKTGSSAGEKCQKTKTKRKQKKPAGWISALPPLTCADAVMVLMLRSSKRVLKIKRWLSCPGRRQSCHVVCSLWVRGERRYANKVESWKKEKKSCCSLFAFKEQVQENLELKTRKIWSHEAKEMTLGPLLQQGSRCLCRCAPQILCRTVGVTTCSSCAWCPPDWACSLLSPPSPSRCPPPTG